MSIFECAENHQVPANHRFCPICHGPVTKMDGKSGKELLEEARRYQAEIGARDLEERSRSAEEIIDRVEHPEKYEESEAFAHNNMLEEIVENDPDARPNLPEDDWRLER